MRPTARAAWEPVAIALAVALVMAFDDARNGVPIGGSVGGVLFAVLISGFACALIFYLTSFAARIGAARRHLLLPIVYRRDVAPAAFVLVTAVLALTESAPAGIAGAAAWALGIVYILRGLLAGPPAGSGNWAIRLVRRCEERSAAWSATGRRLAAFAAAAVVAAILVAPTLAGRTWPLPSERVAIAEWGATATLWDFRIAVFRGDAAEACGLTRLEPDAGRAPCRAIVRLATAIQRADPVADDPATVFGGLGDHERFRFEQTPAPANTSMFALLGPDGRHVGELYTEGPGRSRVVALLARDRPYDAGENPRRLWLYNLERLGRAWRVTGFRACVAAAPGSGSPARCELTDHATPRRVAAMARLIARTGARPQAR